MPVEVQGDPLRLYQILFNLVGNAVKYTQSGEILLGVRVFEDFEDKVALHFAVRDTGIGIATQYHERVFQPFYRLETPESRQYEGSGLGLAIVKELVERMHGQIGLESELGKGSTFWFIIEMDKPLDTARNDMATDDRLEQLRIIVAENDHFHLQNLRRHLGALGLRADQARSGREMLEIVRGAAQRNKPYDLGLISMSLPDLNGQQLAKAIKNEWYFKKMKLVILTSFSDYKHLSPEPEDGIEAYLTKPVSEEKLSHCLASLLNREARSDQDIIEAKTEEPKKLKRFPYRVLVAENNLVNQEVVKAMLQSLGCQVDVVETGKEALAAISEESYALILMDCQMPDMNGFEATKAIRALENKDNARGRMPVVALTAHGMKGDREACLTAGMDDYLTKPFNKEQLQEILAKWLQAQPAPDPETNGSAFSGSCNTRDGEHPPLGTEHLHVGLEELSPGQPLDGRILREIRSLQQEGTSDLLNKVIRAYVSQTPDLMERLFNAVCQGNASEAYEIAHTLKSSSANIGALPLAKLFKKLETLVQEKTLDQAKPILAHISSEYDRVRNALQLEMSG